MASDARSDADAARDPARMTLAAMLDRHLESPSLCLPVCSESAAHVLRELEAGGADAEALQLVVSRDAALVASVLRDANGPEFDALERIATVDRALARLGAERVAGLVGSIVTSADSNGDDPIVTRALHDSWKRSLAVALVTSAIAVRTGSEDLAQKAELLGLLSEVGVVFLISALNAQRSHPGGSPPLTAVAEHEVLGQLQFGYGIRLLERWNLPSSELSVLAGLPNGRDEQRQSRFLRVARHVVSSVGFPPVGCEGEGVDENELWELAEALELSYVDVAALQVHAEDLVVSLSEAAAS
jgi:HD-like signal output (HDOD) protein